MVNFSPILKNSEIPFIANGDPYDLNVIFEFPIDFGNNTTSRVQYKLIDNLNNRSLLENQQSISDSMSFVTKNGKGHITIPIPTDSGKEQVYKL